MKNNLYIVQTVDSLGDAVDELYKGEDINEAYKVAQAFTGKVEIEKMSWDEIDSPEFELIYEGGK